MNFNNFDADFVYLNNEQEKKIIDKIFFILFTSLKCQYLINLSNIVLKIVLNEKNYVQSYNFMFISK
jgi:hypothetical protein